MSHPYQEINKEKKYCNKEVYEEVAEKLGITPELVEEIYNAQSEFAAKIVRRGGFESITFPYLGKIKAKLRAVSKLLSTPKTRKYQ